MVFLNRPLFLVGCFLPFLAIPSPAGDSWTLMNPTGHMYSNEIVRLKIDWPAGAKRSDYTVEEDGKPVGYQVEEIDGKQEIWVATVLPRGRTHKYRLKRQKPPTVEPKVKVSEEDGWWVLDNGLMAVRVPAEHSVAMVGPIGQVRLPGGKWAGKCFWKTDEKLKSFSSELIGDGMAFAKVRLRYEFEGMAGLYRKTPAFAQVDILLPPSRRHAIIDESHEMKRGSYWEFDCAAGWDARQAIVVPHHGGFGRPTMKDPDGKPYPWPPNTLKVGQTRMGDTLLNLWPRWSQAYDDGWFFMAHDGGVGVGSMVVRPGKWFWPHNNGIEIKVKEGADYAGMRCPTWKGKRYWFLVVGSRQTWKDKPAQQRYAMLNAYEALDKLHQEYILDWPGLKAPEGTPPEQTENWHSGAGRFATRANPMMGWQGAGGGYRGNKHPIWRLTQAQAQLDPDAYGNYWIFWSPENPNFASAWNRGGIWSVEKLSGEARYWGGKAIAKHPRYDDLVELAKQKLHEDIYHSITMPSGAGQECHGYMGHSMHLWEGLRYSCQQMGFDPMEWPYIRKAAEFHVRISHPTGDGRRKCHPGGDTHPPGPNIAEQIKKYKIDADFTKFRTEELQGFGVVFRNSAGKETESYLAFKGGPNRGHFHGDQLSLHYAPYGMLLAPDHHCSYGPRAGQEHMHNRMTFHTEKFPYANMDGYERVIAFKTGDVADAAIGQVDSERIRMKEKFPAEQWDRSLPQLVFDELLKYRRTVVFVRNGDRDYVVLRDQHTGPDLSATYCLHVYGDTCEQNGSEFDFDGMRVYVVAPAEVAAGRHDWVHHNGGKEATKGLRLTMKGKTSEFITVLVPKPRKRVQISRITLKKALFVEHRRRGQKPRVQECDVNLILPWDDGKLQAGKARMLSPGLSKHGTVGGSVKAISAKPKGMELEITFVMPRRRKEPEKFVFKVKAKRKFMSSSYVGTYEGKFRGKDRKGEVEGVFEKEGLAPSPMYAEFTPPEVAAIPGGVKVDDDEIIFAGEIGDEDATQYVEVKRAGQTVLSLTGKDIDMDRSQGDIGLFVPDAGYPFGVIPDWLIKQRIKKPDWYRDMWPLTKNTLKRDS